MISIGDNVNRLELVFLGIVTSRSPDAGDLQIAAAARCGDFSGRTESAWVQAEVWVRFLESLRRLERERQGVADVASMSPTEFALRLGVVDRAGHLAAEGHVGTYAHVAGQLREVRLTYAFEIDAGQLASLVRDFEVFAVPAHG